MKEIMRALLAVCLALCASGCATTPTGEQARSGENVLERYSINGTFMIDGVEIEWSLNARIEDIYLGCSRGECVETGDQSSAFRYRYIEEAEFVTQIGSGVEEVKQKEGEELPTMPSDEYFSTRALEIVAKARQRTQEIAVALKELERQGRPFKFPKDES